MWHRALALTLAVTLAGIVPAAGQGTLYTQDLAAFGPELPDSTLEQVRGGFMGMAFSVLFTGWVVNGFSDMAGSLNVSTGSVPDTSSGVTTTTTTAGDQAQVRIAGIAGSAFQGASGLFVITQVPGNNNTISVNLAVQVVFINIPSTAGLPNFSTLFR